MITLTSSGLILKPLSSPSELISVIMQSERGISSLSSIDYFFFDDFFTGSTPRRYRSPISLNLSIKSGKFPVISKDVSSLPLSLVPRLSSNAR